jgi:pimeloyl-ACP methyl ester carboxylesterase
VGHLLRRRACLSLPCAAVGAAGGLSVLPGCGYLPREAVVPMPVIREPLSPTQRADVLVVMLPGAYDAPRDFIRRGFVKALRDRGYAADVLLADAHLRYIENGSMVVRLHDDVVMPARAAGYQRIWLVGISLGGLASLALTMQHPRLIEGVVAIAPYLGNPETIRQVGAAGGAQRYADLPHERDDLEAALWTWLGHTDAAQRAALHLYTGSDDRFIAAHRLLAALLPPDHVVEVPGGHDWRPWTQLWQQWLTRAPWPKHS